MLSKDSTQSSIHIAKNMTAADCNAAPGEVMVLANGIELCTQAFGDPTKPAVLLIMGASASMVKWQDDFCRLLSTGGRYVVRYDNRDMGRSTTFTPYAPPYDLEDMAKDAVGVLDAYNIERAHIIGASSGGMIAQLMAIHHPSRCLSITVAVSTLDPAGSIAASTTGTMVETALPPPSARFMEHIHNLSTVDWSVEAEVVEAFVADMRAMAGSRHALDEAMVHDYARREAGRVRDILSMRWNNPIAQGRTAAWRGRLSDVRIPTLVVEGAEDPVYAIAHGAALADAIPGAQLLTLDGVGHELPRGCWPILLPAILAHTSAT
jgi:pimeloyl-ACP methyl ester carboxylesterase